MLQKVFQTYWFFLREFNNYGFILLIGVPELIFLQRNLKCQDPRKFSGY